MATRGAGLREIAEDVGVSLATVSLALNGRPGVSDETRRRVLASAERHGYPQRTQNRIIGLLIERFAVSAYHDPAVGLMIHGVETEAGRRGYHMLLASIEPKGMRLPAMITERQVGGLIVLGGGDISDAYIHLLADTGLPLVLADNYVNDLDVSCVLGDNATGGYLATRHLIERGHRRIAILEGPRKYKTLTERIEGYVRALDEAQLPLDPSLMVAPIHGSPRKGYFETQSLLARPREEWPTAIFAVSDKTALGALDALKDAGLRVPDDMALVGFDDIADSAHVTPPLTTIHAPLQGIGEVAMKRLADLLEGTGEAPYRSVLYTKLVARQSTGAGHSSSAEQPDAGAWAGMVGVADTSRA